MLALLIKTKNNIFCLFFLFVLFPNYIHAQFTITENFRGGTLSSDIVKGGDAILTSGNADPVNNGWLRLTNNSTYQRGYAYINKSFPATMGINFEFEYKT